MMSRMKAASRWGCRLPVDPDVCTDYGRQVHVPDIQAGEDDEPTKLSILRRAVQRQGPGQLCMYSFHEADASLRKLKAFESKAHTSLLGTLHAEVA